MASGVFLLLEDQQYIKLDRGMTAPIFFAF